MSQTVALRTTAPFRRRAQSVRRRPHGLGLVELLISLAIAAALLTAVGVAVNASFIAYQVNEEQSMLVQRARIVMVRMQTMLRTTDAHSPEDPVLSTMFSTGFTVNDKGVSMISPSGTTLTYHYDAANKRLLAIDNGKTYTMLEGVESFQVTLEPMRSAESLRTGGNYDLLERATVLLSVRTNAAVANGTETTNRQIVTMSASAMPRKNIW